MMCLVGTEKATYKTTTGESSRGERWPVLTWININSSTLKRIATKNQTRKRAVMKGLKLWDLVISIGSLTSDMVSHHPFMERIGSRYQYFNVVSSRISHRFWSKSKMWTFNCVKIIVKATLNVMPTVMMDIIVTYILINSKMPFKKIT